MTGRTVNRTDVEMIGSDVFLELDESYNIKTTFDFLLCEGECFVLRINTTNKSITIEESKLIPSIDYLIDVFKRVKRLGLMTGYTPTFNKLTTVDDTLIYHKVCLYFLFESNES